MYSICRQCVTVGGGGAGGILNCTVDHILQEFYTLFLTRFRTYKIATPPQTKVISKDDIKGFVSLKFLRLCYKVYFYSMAEDLRRIQAQWEWGWGDETAAGYF
jgi:hypothetical protein